LVSATNRIIRLTFAALLRTEFVNQCIYIIGVNSQSFGAFAAISIKQYRIGMEPAMLQRRRREKKLAQRVSAGKSEKKQRQAP